jgi:hypothetical protein
MAEMNISDAAAEALIAMERCCADDQEWSFPHPGEWIAIPLTSLEKRDFHAGCYPIADQAHQVDIPEPRAKRSY